MVFFVLDNVEELLDYLAEVCGSCWMRVIMMGKKKYVKIDKKVNLQKVFDKISLCKKKIE